MFRLNDWFSVDGLLLSINVAPGHSSRCDSIRLMKGGVMKRLTFYNYRYNFSGLKSNLADLWRRRKDAQRHRNTIITFWSPVTKSNQCQIASQSESIRSCHCLQPVPATPRSPKHCKSLTRHSTPAIEHHVPSGVSLGEVTLNWPRMRNALSARGFLMRFHPRKCKTLDRKTLMTRALRTSVASKRCPAKRCIMAGTHASKGS